MTIYSNVTYDGNQFDDGETLSLNLTKYQTFTISGEVDFTGTVINSNDSVAVFVGLRYNNDHSSIWFVFDIN